MNILILSSGTRNKIIQYFKRELGDKGKVIATDMSTLAPSLYEADKYYIVPRITAPNYIDKIFEICKAEKVDGIFSLIDPEISLIAKHKEKFLEIGVTPLVSEYELVEKCLDKIEFMKMLKQKGYKTIKSYDSIDSFRDAFDKNEVSFPVFVKPIKGSASLNISKVNNFEELKLIFENHANLMIQEFMSGTEYGVDAYVDILDGEVKSIFIKEKILMRAGETDKSKSVVNDEFFEFVKKFLIDFSFKGVVDIDIFEQDGVLYVSEVNPRFGGGYPHAYELGVNIPDNIIRNLNGKINKINIGDYSEGKYMMKYNELLIK